MHIIHNFVYIIIKINIKIWVKFFNFTKIFKNTDFINIYMYIYL